MMRLADLMLMADGWKGNSKDDSLNSLDSLHGGEIGDFQENPKPRSIFTNQIARVIVIFDDHVLADWKTTRMEKAKHIVSTVKNNVDDVIIPEKADIVPIQSIDEYVKKEIFDADGVLMKDLFIFCENEAKGSLTTTKPNDIWTKVQKKAVFSAYLIFYDMTSNRNEKFGFSKILEPNVDSDEGEEKSSEFAITKTSPVSSTPPSSPVSVTTIPVSVSTGSSTSARSSPPTSPSSPPASPSSSSARFPTPPSRPVTAPVTPPAPLSRPVPMAAPRVTPSYVSGAAPESLIKAYQNGMRPLGSRMISLSKLLSGDVSDAYVCEPIEDENECNDHPGCVYKTDAGCAPIYKKGDLYG